MLYPYIYYHFNCKNTTNFDYITYKLINLIFTQQSKKITYVSLIKKKKNTNDYNSVISHSTR